MSASIASVARMSRGLCTVAVAGLVAALLAPAGPASADGPRVWVSSDLTNPEQENPTDFDDIVTMSGFLLLANRFTIEGIVVGVDPRDGICPGAATWANDELAAAYSLEVGNLNASLGGYPASVSFTQSDSCEAPFNGGEVINLANYPSVAGLIDAAQDGPLNVLSWGPMTEPARAVKYLIDNGQTGTLNNITIISHWTSPPANHNCAIDTGACDYLHDLAADGDVALYELGPMGQQGLVDNSCGSSADLSMSTMLDSEIGSYMNYKWTGDGWPDMSDGATYLVLDGFGGGLGAYDPDGSEPVDGPNNLCSDRPGIADALHAAATAAAGGGGGGGEFTSTAVALHSDKCLDVPGGSGTPGLQWNQWDCVPSSLDQSFVFTEATGGTHTIRSQASNLCATVDAGSTADGASVVQQACTGADNQRFTLQPVAGTGSADDVQLVAAHSGKCVDVTGVSTANGALIQQWTCNPNPLAQLNQVWHLPGLGGGGGGGEFTSTAVALHSDKCLDVPGGSGTPGLQWNQWDCVPSSLDQSFVFTEATGGTHTIRSQASNLCATVDAGSTADGASVVQQACTGADNQRFTLQPVAGTGSADDVQLVAAHSGKCVDVTGVSTANGALIQQWTCNPNPLAQLNQVWHIAG